MIAHINQKRFAERWGVSRQYIGKLVRRGALTLCCNGKLDLVFSDSYMIRSGAGLLCIPENPANQEQYQRRREIRRSIMHHYESQNETELTQEEIDLIDNDPQLVVRRVSNT